MLITIRSANVWEEKNMAIALEGIQGVKYRRRILDAWFNGTCSLEICGTYWKSNLWSHLSTRNYFHLSHLGAHKEPSEIKWQSQDCVGGWNRPKYHNFLKCPVYDIIYRSGPRKPGTGWWGGDTAVQSSWVGLKFTHQLQMRNGCVIHPAARCFEKWT